MPLHLRLSLFSVLVGLESPSLSEGETERDIILQGKSMMEGRGNKSIEHDQTS